MTLRAYIEAAIADGLATSIGPKRFRAESLQFLLADYDAYMAGQPSHADSWAKASVNDPGASMDVARLGGGGCG